MPTIRAVFVAVLLLAIAAPTSAARVPKDFVGLDSQGTFQDTFNNDPAAARANLSAQHALGVRIHRQPFNWELIESKPDVYDFSFTDRYMQEMAAQGVRVLPVLFDAPPWDEGSGQQLDKGIHAPPKSGRPLGDFGAALIRRYGPNGSFWVGKPASYRRLGAIRAWQIWNEPNLRYYWGGKPNARQYVKVLKAAVKRMRAVDPNAEIVTAGIPQSSLRGTIPLKKFTNKMYKAGGKKWFDTFGLNAYAKNKRDLQTKVKLVRNVMDKHRDRKARIWITEIGWADTGNKHYLVKGPRGQARQITRCFKKLGKLRTKQRIRGFIYYMWQDAIPTHREGVDPNTWGWHTGLLRLDGSPKPAYNAFKTAVGKL